MKLTDYIYPLISPTFGWITFLTLSHIICSRADLINISKLTNLGVLTIGPNLNAPEVGLEDNVVRAWERTATSTGAFSMLRVLNCRSQKQITPRVFKHMSQFPALALFNVEDCNLGPGDKSAAKRHGWKYRTGKDFSDSLVKAGATGAGWDQITQSCFRIGGALSTDYLTAEGMEAIDSLPILHMGLGAAPADAVHEVAGDRSIRSFYRLERHDYQQPEALQSSHKRVLSQSQESLITFGRKKPTVRPSKQQNLEDLFLGLNG